MLTNMLVVPPLWRGYDHVFGTIKDEDLNTSQGLISCVCILSPGKPLISYVYRCHFISGLVSKSCPPWMEQGMVSVCTEKVESKLRSCSDCFSNSSSFLSHSRRLPLVILTWFCGYCRSIPKHVIVQHFLASTFVFQRVVGKSSILSSVTIWPYV